jgi:hypothetical protein
MLMSKRRVVCPFLYLFVLDVNQSGSYVLRIISKIEFKYNYRAET